MIRPSPRPQPGEEFRTAVLLWCVAWHQQPAASLPDDDRLLAHLAGFGRDVRAWTKVRKGALHGFIGCADGRLYHPTIAEKALDAWARKQNQQDRTKRSAALRMSGLLDSARAYLLDALADGPVPVAEIQSWMKGRGISWSTLKRTKQELGLAICENRQWMVLETGP